MSLNGYTVFVTGATGLIGKALCRKLVRIGAKVVALVRNRSKAAETLPNGVTIVTGDVTDPIVYQGECNYIVHGAGPTASRDFAEKPVEVINAIVSGAKHTLEFAREKRIKGLVFLSTMEVYGLTDSEDVTETGYATLDTMSPRNCYPVAKRLAECLFASAVKEYGVPATIARLTQTFGIGVTKEDQRVFAQFARAVKFGQDIILKSDGKTERCYCSVNDAVDAIITLLVKGKPGVAYNVANPETFCSIREMAEFVSHEFSAGKSKVLIDTQGVNQSGYLPSFRMRLNIDQLKLLGWEPKENLKCMFQEVIDGL